MCTVPSPISVRVEPGQSGKDSKKKSASKEVKKHKGSTEKKAAGSSVKEEVCFLCTYACTHIPYVQYWVTIVPLVLVL